MNYKTLIYLSLIAIGLSCTGVESIKYKDTSLSFEERVDDLVSRMTLEEKISQLKFDAPAIERLDVPKYNWWNECLHGVARSGKATVFPQAIGMAATWDTDQINEVSKIISEEARAKYNDYQARGKRGIYEGLTFWTPNINIFRDPRWGRGMETYGEDPYLTGEIGSSFIQGLQGDHEKYFKAIATSKHYVVHSGPEPERHSFNATTREVDFWETYMPGFIKTIQKGGAYSVMCAYNRYDGEACCGSDYLLQDLLRDRIGFDGYVVSDCGAIRDFYTGHFVVETPAEAAALGVKSGTDLNCGDVYPALEEAVEQGLITEEEIDVAVKRLFLARFKLGMFDGEDDVPFNDIPLSVLDKEEHKHAALETAQKSIVLLKNENNALPLSKEIQKVAVIGPNANDREVLLANYNGIPEELITPYQGIKNKLPNADVQYALGCEHAKGLPTFEPIPSSALYTDESMSQQGLKAAYYDNKELEGEPVAEQIDPNIDFYWWDKAPMEGLEDDNFGVRWSGVFVPEKSGEYALGGEGFNDFDIYLEDSLFVSFRNIHHSRKIYEFLELEANKPYKIEVEFMERHGDANMHLLWAPPKEDIEQEALDLANASDAVILFMGLSPRLEGEEMKVRVEGFRGGDRLTLDLPQLQKDFIKKVYNTGKPVVLVLLSGSAVSINWEQENLPAIMQAWYPGQAAGTAIADALFGDYNPAGRLPVTFYKSVDQLPPFDDYVMEGKTYRYFEDEVLYPFGYGLSYTTFEYGEINLESNEITVDDDVVVSVNIENNGDMAGEEVVQLYVKSNLPQKGRPIKELKGFERISLQAGESKEVTFILTSDELSFWDVENDDYKVFPGEYEILVGSSSADADLTSTSFVIK
jgi:beta-glucosidase